MTTPWGDQREATEEQLRRLDLSVDVLSINIAKGDSALYLLIQHPPPNATDTKPFIHRAVLIDGGVKGTGADAINNVLKDASKLYHYDKQGERDLQFPALDAIVATHWDEDHATGLLSLIDNEIWSNVDDRNEDTYLCPFMKYQNAPANSPRANRAMTTFYAPYWAGRSFPGKGRTWFKASTPTDEDYNPKGAGTFLDWAHGRGWVGHLCMLRTHVECVLGANLFTGKVPAQYTDALDMRSPQHLAYWHQNDQTPDAHPIQVADELAWPVLCIVAGARNVVVTTPRGAEKASAVNVCCGQRVAGRDVEREKQAITTKYATIVDDDAEPQNEMEQEVRDYFKQKALSMPTLAATRASISSSGLTDRLLAKEKGGLSPLIQAPLSPRPNKEVLKIVDTPNNPADDGDFTNMHSLVTLVIWTTGQLSFFSAGDANWESEMNVVAWCAQENNPFKCVRSIKLGHHGSATSTPYEMIRAFKPRNIIISADMSLHGHPRWELILYLYLWLRSTADRRVVVNLENRIGPRFLIRSTSYPYYLTWNIGDVRFARENQRISFNAFSDAPRGEPDEIEAIEKYQGMMKLLIAKVFPGPDPYIDEFNKPGLANEFAFINRLVQEAWNALSEVGVDSLATFPVNGVSEERYQTRARGDNGAVIFVKTHCRPFSRERRLKADGYVDGASYPIKVGQSYDEILRASRTTPLARPYKALAWVIGAVRNNVMPVSWRPGYDSIVDVSRSACLRVQKTVGWAKYMPARTTAALQRGQLQDVKNPPVHLFAQRLAGLAAAADQGVSTPTGPPLSVTPAPAQDFFLVPDVTDVDWATAYTGPVYRVPVGPGEEDLDSIAVFLMMLENPALKLRNDLSLTEDDPFRAWLLQAVHEIPLTSHARVSVSLTGTQTKTNVVAITLMLPATDSRPAMAYSTSTLVGNFSDRSLPSLAGKPPMIETSGFYPMHSFLCLGLTPDGKPWSLAQVLSQINVDASAATQNLGAVLAAVVDVLTKSTTPLQFILNRGMIWFLPNENYLTVQRLEWGLNADTEKALGAWCKEWMPSHLVLQKPTIVARRSCTRMDTPTNTGLSFEHEMLVMCEIVKTGVDPATDYIITCGLDLNLAGGSETLIATIRVDPASFDAENVGLLDFIGWLVPEVDISGVGTVIPVINNIMVRSVELKISKTDTGSVSIDRIVVRAEYSNPSWKVSRLNSTAKVEVPFLLTYTWTRGLSQPHGVNLMLWLEPEILQWFTPQVMPKYEDLYYIRPSSLAPNYLGLKDLMDGDYHLPSELSYVITELSLDLQDTTVTFNGKLEKDPAVTTGTNLGISLDEVDVTASFTWSDKTSKTQPQKNSYMIRLHTEITLSANPTAEPTEANTDNKPKDALLVCDVNLLKAGDRWNFQLRGDVVGLNMAQLGRFFPDGDADIVKELLGHITLAAFNITYNYDSGPKNPTDPKAPQGASASDFAVTATLILADVLELDVKFTRDSTQWSFDAILHSSQKSLTVEQVVGALLGDKGAASVADIPSFVKAIDLSKAAVKLSLRSLQPTKDTPSSSLSVCLALDIPGPESTMLEFAFLQITTKPTPTTAPADIQGATKRIVKVTLGGLPWDKIPRVPVVDNVKPAFDSLGFYWVQDPTWKDVKKQPGLTRQEVQSLNELSPVIFKETKGSTDATKDPAAAGAVVLPAGMHFLVLDSGGQGPPRAILDYLFNKPKAPVSSPLGTVAGSSSKPIDLLQAKADNTADNTDTTPTGTSKATLEKTVGPFSVSNVGIRYENSELVIFLDIHANMGPIKLALMGFGFGLNLKNTSLKDLVTQVPTFHLQGMGIEFNQPPVGITGMFVERQENDVKLYVGGVALTIAPYSFMAVGAYGEVKKPAGDTFKTVFFFAKLNGPLIELEFITIGGVCLGFGYNSSIRKPSIREVPSFPFIANSSLPGDNPLAVMEKLSSLDPAVGVVTPQESSYWLAAGIEAKALQVLDVSAVIILEFNPYVSLGIFGKAVAQMPPAPTPREGCFLYVELGILAVVDFGAGALRVEAELSPNSFVIAPACRLTGGFALCVWFAPSAYTGDFVFTVGGYHAAFRPPAHYPTPSRLGISWSLSDELAVRGEAYFAVTPKCCMGGGKLQVNCDAGLLHAWLTAWADFLMEYHPFSFIADIGLEVGVKFTLELLFVSIDISITLRAELTLWGVPFGGEVYVDFWVFGFTIGFGEDQQSPAITLTAFQELLFQVPDGDSAAATGEQAGTVDRLHVLSVETGRYTEKAKEGDTTTKQGDMWEVKRGGFVFRVQSRVPLQHVVQPKFLNDAKKKVVTSAISDTPFYARPMHLRTQLTSSMSVTVTKHEDSAVMEFTPVKAVLKQVPLALWGFYDPEKSPGRNKNNVTDLLDPKDGTAELMMGASFHCPPPLISKDKLVPFNVLEANSLDVFTNADAKVPGGDEHPQLTGDVVMQDRTWNSAQPAQDVANKAKQWEIVRNVWKQPEIAIDTSAPDDAVQDALEATAALWSDAFGWDLGNAENRLKNELHPSAREGVEPIVWREFEELYMAPPFIGVAA